MALFGRKKSDCGIGLDIGSKSLKLIKLKKEDGDLYLKAVGVADLPEGVIVNGTVKEKETFANVVRNLINNCDPEIEDVVVSVGAASILSDKITFSYENSDNVADDIIWEAKQKSPFDAEDITIDYKVLSENEEEQKMFILLAAAKNAGMDSFIDALYEAGVCPTAVDVNSYAFNNCYSKENEFEDNPETLALMDVGYRGSRVLFVKDGIYHSARDMNIGGEYITKSLQRQLNIDFGQAYSIMLGKKIKGVSLEDIQAAFKSVFDEFLSGFDMAFSYYRKDSGDVSVEKVVLCGGGVYIPGLVACLSNHLGIEITISNPFSFLKYDEKLFNDVDPARFGALLSVATGLALRGV